MVFGGWNFIPSMRFNIGYVRERELTIQSYAEIYQDYSAISRLLSSSLWEHSGSSLAPFQHPVRLAHIIDSIYHHDLEVTVLLERH